MPGSWYYALLTIPEGVWSFLFPQTHRQKNGPHRPPEESQADRDATRACPGRGRMRLERVEMDLIALRGNRKLSVTRRWMSRSRTHGRVEGYRFVVVVVVGGCEWLDKKL